MKLRNKTFLYSIVISLAVGVAILGYMIFMLPPLYMEYRLNENLANSEDMFNHLIEKGSLAGAKFKDSSSFGVVIPKEGYRLELSNSAFKGYIEPGDEYIKETVDSIRESSFEDYKKGDPDIQHMGKEFEEKFKKLSARVLSNVEKDFKFKFEGTDNINFKEGDIKFHSVGKSAGLAEMSVINKSTGTKYTSYVGVGKKQGQVFLFMNSVITPTADDIKPVIYRAIPVFIPLIILLAFCISVLYSGKIIRPIEDLERDARKRQNQGMECAPISVESDDEIGDLAKSLNLLYAAQAESFKRLSEEGRRKEIFMRSSSHQLKTPIAAATLLVDSMISNVGKFSDKDRYLPMVKEKLAEMSEIVNRVLELNHLSYDEDRTYVDVAGLCSSVSESYRIEMDNKGIALSIDSSEYNEAWHSNGDMLRIIIDNLVSNAVKYCDDKGFVKILVTNDAIIVKNAPGNLDESIKASIFEPFVTGTKNGHGLGLYVSRYFANLLNLRLEIEGEIGENNESVVVAAIRK